MRVEDECEVLLLQATEERVGCYLRDPMTFVSRMENSRMTSCSKAIPRRKEKEAEEEQKQHVTEIFDKTRVRNISEPKETKVTELDSFNYTSISTASLHNHNVTSTVRNKP